jgi:hypothetical protein
MKRFIQLLLLALVVVSKAWSVPVGISLDSVRWFVIGEPEIMKVAVRLGEQQQEDRFFWQFQVAKKFVSQNLLPNAQIFSKEAAEGVNSPPPEIAKQVTAKLTALCQAGPGANPVWQVKLLVADPLGQTKGGGNETFALIPQLSEGILTQSENTTNPNVLSAPREPAHLLHVTRTSLQGKKEKPGEWDRQAIADTVFDCDTLAYQSVAKGIR